jgi:hypothetical protein
LIGSQQAHPVILSALKRFSVSETQKLLWLLEVAIVRFLLVGGGNPGRFEPACARLAQSIYDGNIKTAAAAFAELKDVYPPDLEFESAFKVKREGTNQKAQYFLRGLEKEEQRLAKGKMAGEWEPGAVTVEHVLPKKPGTDFERNNNSRSRNSRRLCNAFRKHVFADKNQCGNKGFAKKKPTFSKSELLTTKAIVSYTTWDRTAIDSRQADLAKLAKSVWRFT